MTNLAAGEIMPFTIGQFTIYDGGGGVRRQHQPADHPNEDVLLSLHVLQK